MAKYDLQAGRCITKDGVPFVTIHGCGQYNPTEVDEFARFIAGVCDVMAKDPPPEPPTTKYVCTQCGSSDVYADAYAGLNDQGILTFQQEFCARCDGECSTEEVPIDTPEPVGETIRGRHL